MDKRWIYIIIIAIAGIGCLYLTAESSNNIASANINVDKFIITVPQSFNIEKSGGDDIRLINRENGERINVAFLGKGTDIDQNMTDKINALSQNGNITVMETTTTKINNETVPIIYYEKLPNNSVNQVAFITKFDYKFSIECANFNDNATITHHIEFISDSLKKDFKHKQDL